MAPKPSAKGPTPNNVTRSISNFFQPTSGQPLAPKLVVDPSAKRGRGNEAAPTVISPEQVAAKKPRSGADEGEGSEESEEEAQGDGPKRPSGHRRPTSSLTWETWSKLFWWLIQLPQPGGASPKCGCSVCGPDLTIARKKCNLVSHEGTKRHQDNLAKLVDDERQAAETAINL
jgi:hypothetical protein